MSDSTSAVQAASTIQSPPTGWPQLAYEASRRLVRARDALPTRRGERPRILLLFGADPRDQQNARHAAWGLTNQANRRRADGAPAPPASGPVERVVRAHCFITPIQRPSLWR